MAKKKLLLDFLLDYVRDSKLRCKVLKAEQTGLRQYGLDAPQRVALLSLDKARITDKILQEIGVNLDALREEIWGGGTVTIGGITAALAVASAYSEGRIHVRIVKPDQLRLGRTETIHIRGQGFDKTPKVQFQHDASGSAIDGRVTKVTCDVDVHQTLTVRVKLDQAGPWTVAAKNTAGEAWNVLDQKKVTVA